MDKIKFQCSGCGECCRRIGALSAADKKRLDFPYNAKKDGSCEKLGDDGKCMVYDNRPLICNVEKTYEKYHAPHGRSMVDVYIAENKICNELITQANLDKKYLLSLVDYLKYK